MGVEWFPRYLPKKKISNKPALAFYCTAIGWGLDVDGAPAAENPSSAVCDPLDVLFNNVAELHDNCGCTNVTGSVEVTE